MSFTISIESNVKITTEGIYAGNTILFGPDLVAGLDPATIDEPQRRHAELTAELNPINLTSGRLIIRIGDNLFGADYTATTANLRPHQVLGRFFKAEKHRNGSARWACKLNTIRSDGQNKVELLYPQGWFTGSKNHGNQAIRHKDLDRSLRDIAQGQQDWSLEDITLACYPTISNDDEDPLLTKLDVEIQRSDADWTKLTTINSDDARALAKTAVLTLKNSSYTS